METWRNALSFPEKYKNIHLEQWVLVIVKFHFFFIFFLFLSFKKKSQLVRVLFALPPLNKNVRPFAADLRKLSGNTPWHPRKRPGTCVSTSQSRPTSTQGRRPSSESSGWVRTVWKCQWCWYSQSHPGTQRSCWGARRRAVCTGRSRAWFHR